MSEYAKIINEGGLLLLGCGKMGTAMLRGWLNAGVQASAVTVIDPFPSDWVSGLQDQGLKLNPDTPDQPKVSVLAVKPQMMLEAAPSLQAFGGGNTVFVSIAAGTTLETLQAVLGNASPIVRCMPNTPAAVGQGITALFGNAAATDPDLELARNLLGAVGQTVLLDNEEQMDAVTAVSGSGPAYVFFLIEVLAEAGEREGLPADLALALAKATILGAGHLAQTDDHPPSELRVHVTSPGGTTAAALEVLMDEDKGIRQPVLEAVARAAARSRELGRPSKS